MDSDTGLKLSEPQFAVDRHLSVKAYLLFLSDLSVLSG